MARPNKDQRLYDHLVKLRTHLNTCNGCRTALKCNDTMMMCRDGLVFTLAAAGEMDQIVRLRLNALQEGGKLIFACPDPSKHGKAYAMTAQPMVAIGYQERLF